MRTDDAMDILRDNIFLIAHIQKREYESDDCAQEPDDCAQEPEDVDPALYEDPDAYEKSLDAERFRDEMLDEEAMDRRVNR